MFGPSSVTSAVSSASISSASVEVSVDQIATTTINTKIPNPIIRKLLIDTVYQTYLGDVVF